MSVCCEAEAGSRDRQKLYDPVTPVRLDALSTEQRLALEHDLTVAAEIQARLLPARSLAFGRWQIHYHYQPLGTVSGDHCDLIRPHRASSSLYFLFGDVSGKGVAASILMANLQALFRGLVSLELPLAEIVTRANRLFAERTGTNTYATLVAGRIDGDGGLEIVNAGHNPPALVRSAGVVWLDAAAVPLGLLERTRYRSQGVPLAADDFLLLYTDGLTEATEPSGEMYGPGRLRAAIEARRGTRARAVVEGVVESMRRFQAGVPGVDDVTVMALRWRGEGGARRA